jgi:rRNA-processing protein FCF1
MKSAEQRAALDAVAGDLSGAIRNLIIQPAETAIAAVERIRIQTYDPAVTEHAIAQLRELKNALRWKLKSDLQAIRRLCDNLEAFERQLTQMSRPIKRGTE